MTVYLFTIAMSGFETLFYNITNRRKVQDSRKLICYSKALSAQLGLRCHYGMLCDCIFRPCHGKLLCVRQVLFLVQTQVVMLLLIQRLSVRAPETQWRWAGDV